MSALCTFNGQLRCVDLDDGLLYNARRLKSQICQDKGLDADDFYVVWNGKIVEDEAKLRTDAIYHVCYRLPGGKGGFGSMLRMIGAQIEKTTNREACRDLSGRRLRDVNDEKRLAEWLKKQADKERERQARKREKLERMASEPKHIFNDQKYSQQKESIMENVHDALSQGMQAAATQAAASSGSSMKRKSNGKGHSGGKKQRLWLGVDFVDSSSDDGDDDDEEEEEETEEDKEMKKLCQKYLDEMKREASMEPGSGGDGDNQASCSYKSQSSDSAPSSSRGSSGAVTGEADCVEASDAKTDTNATECGTENREGSDRTTGKGEHSLLSSLPPPRNDPETDRSADPHTGQSEENQAGEIDLEEYGSANELESLGLESLKAALMDRGLKCGGTLQERASRLFAVKGLEKHQIDPSFFAKPAKGKRKK